MFSGESASQASSVLFVGELTKQGRLERGIENSSLYKEDLWWWLDPTELQKGISLKLLNPNLVLFFRRVVNRLGGNTRGRESVRNLERGTGVLAHRLQRFGGYLLARQFFEVQVCNRVVLANSDNTTCSLFSLAREIIL